MHHDSEVTTVSFQPTDSRRLISSSLDGTVRQWNIDGNMIGRYSALTLVTHVAYSLDGTRFVSCEGGGATVRDSESGEEVARLVTANWSRCGCFSPNGNFVAYTADNAIYMWDITGAEPRLVGNFFGHTGGVMSIAFSSSLVSLSFDRSVKFWQTGASQTLTDPIATDDKPTLLASAAIESINIFAKDGVAVTSDSSGALKTWDIATGRCKSSFSTPAKGIRDTHLANGTLVVVWYERGKGQEGGEYRIWDVGKGRPLRAVGWSWTEPSDLRVSGDRSRLFVLRQDRSIQAWSTRTGRDIGYTRTDTNVESLEDTSVESLEDTSVESLEDKNVESSESSLIVHNSKVWCTHPGSTGWDFGGPGISPLPSYRESPDRLRFDFVDRSIQNGVRPAWILDTVTGSLVFRLPERYMKPSTKTRWDGRYLVVGCPSGEVAIMDFDHLNPQ